MGDEDVLEGEAREEEAPPPQPHRVENAHELLNALPPEAYDLPRPPQPPQQPEPELPPREAREALVAADQVLPERPNAPPDMQVQVQVREVPHAPPAAPAVAAERDDDGESEPEFLDALAFDDVRAVPQGPSEIVRKRVPAAAVAAAAASSRAPHSAFSPMQRPTAAAPRGLHNFPSSTSAQHKLHRSKSLERQYIDLT